MSCFFVISLFIVLVAPPDGGVRAQAAAAAVFFNEPIDPASLNPVSFSLTGAGLDGLLDTADDETLAVEIQWRPDILGAFARPRNRLVRSLYRARLTTAITDLAGNALEAGTSWIFTVFDIADDRDGDGVPDAVELALGLDPDNPDSNDDGISDGEEDFDGDGVPNALEIVLGHDPTRRDSDDDGIDDDEEDQDGDGLTDLAETLIHGTRFDRADSDGDGFSDGEEIKDFADPLDRRSLPRSLANFAGGGSVLNRSLFHSGQMNLIGLAVRNQSFNLVNESSAIGVSIRNNAAPDYFDGKVDGPVISVADEQ